MLLKGGTVLSLDPKVGDFDTADVLIDGSKIAAVGPNLKDVPSNAVVIDASQSIVMPGFIDTHRHMWEGQLRNILPERTAQRLHTRHHRRGPRRFPS